MECTNDGDLCSTDVWSVLTMLIYAVLIHGASLGFLFRGDNIETAVPQQEGGHGVRVHHALILALRLLQISGKSNQILHLNITDI